MGKGGRDRILQWYEMTLAGGREFDGTGQKKGDMSDGSGRELYEKEEREKRRSRWKEMCVLQWERA